jgi:hypothetical protein
MKEYKIIHANGHYEAYDNNGNFLCSGDSYIEVVREIEEG